MSSPTYDVDIANIAPTTTPQHLTEFFTFCGKIASTDFDPAAHAAVVRFEKPSAAKTALMLNGGTLDGAPLAVSARVEHPDPHDATPTSTHPLDQTDKPRSAIAAEYLARGYALSDAILQRAIELDSQKGISRRFLDYFHGVDRAVGERALGREQTVTGALGETVRHAGDAARRVDEERGISVKATDYYSRALASPWGQKVKEFYTTTSKQVLDIHEEAKRIAAAQRPAGSGEPTHTSTAAPPDPAVSAAAAGPADELKPKTTEAPTVL